MAVVVKSAWLMAKSPMVLLTAEVSEKPNLSNGTVSVIPIKMAELSPADVLFPSSVKNPRLLPTSKASMRAVKAPKKFA